MKEFSKKSFLQKSLAMLFAMFLLGACSTTVEESVNSDWKTLVAGKTVYVSGDSAGSFSADASSFSIYSEETGAYSLPIKTSTATGATYEFSEGVLTYVFSGVTSTGGQVSVSGTGAKDFTFSN